MKRSENHHAIARGLASFQAHGWALPPDPKVGRFPAVEEDEAPFIPLLGEKK